MKKQRPKLKSDKELETFLESDLSRSITPENLYPSTFEFAPKSKVVNLRMSDELLTALKKVSKNRGIPYQRYIREAVERSIKKDGTRG